MVITNRRIAVGAIASAICIIAFTALSAIKVHSESDVKYRQTRFADVGISAINPHPVSLDDEEEIKPFYMTYEVGKVTPTPTPVFVANDEIWYRIADCESHRNWKADTGNGYYGALQFSQGAWNSVGGSGKPSDASAEEQIMRGKLLQQVRGWGAWGMCAKKLGLN